jgi:hypothetical protein
MPPSLPSEISFRIYHDEASLWDAFRKCPDPIPGVDISFDAGFPAEDRWVIVNWHHFIKLVDAPNRYMAFRVDDEHVTIDRLSHLMPAALLNSHVFKESTGAKEDRWIVIEPKSADLT